MKKTEWVLPFEGLGIKDVARVGGKNASLGEMISRLKGEGLRVPGGFAGTAAAFRAYLHFNGISEKLHALQHAHETGHSSLQRMGRLSRALILKGAFPPGLESQLLHAYARLGSPAVAVRSSATAEDLPGASFAGQQESYLNVRGPQALLKAVKNCYASLYTERAISYRIEQGFAHDDVALSVGVQRMVRSDLAGSGVMFSIDTESGFAGNVVLTASWGLGENVVKGRVNPDEYLVFKAGLKNRALVPILRRSLGAKERLMDYAPGGGTRDRRCPPAKRARFVLSDGEVLELSRAACAIEAHYGRPMDIEWAKDGQDGKLYIVQARPETVQARKSKGAIRSYRLKKKGKLILSGLSVGDAIAQGPVCRIRSPKELSRFKPGSILVTSVTDPDWVPLMRLASGIITDHGGRTCHAAIVSRELGIPAVVGTGRATRLLKEGQAVTLSCAEGSEGRIYAGKLDFEAREIKLSRLPKTKTKMMLNLASPAAAQSWWHLPAQGVGLARMEFIINDVIRIHPMALVRYPKLKDAAAAREIARLTKGYADKKEYFVDKLAEGIAQIAATQYPHPVIVRLSDFKTNEYARLLGGAEFEPHEENPMIGWRGASRYYHEGYKEGFALECRALKRVRESMGLKNVVVMVPFCRTPEEADKVLAEMFWHGLRRGRAGLEVYVMCEIPSNVIMAKEFSRRFDGFSIGSNDLTQLTLGVDRDSGTLSKLFDERHPAVMRSIALVIRMAHAEGVKVGICGQAPSDHPDFAAFLVRQGIDSISLNPDSFVAALRSVGRQERAR